MLNENRQFVDREREITDIKELLHAMQIGSSIQFPIREYVGISGIGKTTLLTAICQECETVPVNFISIDLAKQNETNKTQQTKTLLRQIFAKLTDLNRTVDLSPSEADLIISNYLDTHETENLSTLLSLPVALGNLVSSFSGVLVLDSIDQLPDDNLEYIGREIIEPLSSSERNIVILGTRSKINWGANKYKLLRRTKSISLRSFSSTETRQQLTGSSFENLCDEIQSITTGHPGSNDVIVDILSYIEQSEQKKINKSQFSDYESRLVAGVVDKVIRQKVVIPEKLFKAFSILSILRRFDVDIPPSYLVRIDPTVNWNAPLPIMKLIQDMVHDTSYVVSLDTVRNSYAIDTFVRKALSLYVRFFFPDDYLALSKEAFAYYERKLAKSPNDVNLIVEKLYHLADIVRLSLPQKYDLAIAVALRTLLESDLLNSFGTLYHYIEDEVKDRQVVANIQEQQRAFDRLRLILEEDYELSERIGDHDDFLVKALDDLRTRLFETGKAILSIRKHISLVESSNQNTQYSFIFSDLYRDIEITIPLDIPQRKLEKLRRDIRQSATISEILHLGKVIQNQFVPPQVQDILSIHSGPLLINVNDHEVPWELICDHDLLSTRLALGKLLKTSGEAKVGIFKKQHHLHPLLVGVPKSNVDTSESLVHIANIINELSTSLRGIDGISFNPDRDVLLGESADSYEFLKLLSSGDYNIVHFIGCTIYDEQNGSGLVLSDTIVSLEEIARNLEGMPLFFLDTNQLLYDRDRGFYLTKVNYVGECLVQVASALIRGGAMACVGNIWKGIDNNNAKFALRFYEHLLKGTTLGEALRRTKVEFRLNHPSELAWIAYHLIGDPNRKISFTQSAIAP